MKLKLLLLTLLLNLSFSKAQNIDDEISKIESNIQDYEGEIRFLKNNLEALKLKKLRNDLEKHGLPQLNTGEALIKHSALYLVYSEKHEQAKWVAHIITSDIIQGNAGRSNDFRTDPLISTGSSVEADYFLKHLQEDSSYKYDGYGYDRGHLAPSADFRWSKKALSESYFYSNMSPQLPDFNRDSWAKLENAMREYVYRNASSQLYVVTGPILEDDLPKIERSVNGVSIPKKYFKVALDLKNKRAIAFILLNQKTHYPLASYAVSIDEVEAITGIDFFSNLDDSLEKELEAQNNVTPFIPQEEQGDVKPIDPTILPAGTFNTVQAKLYMDKNKKIQVRGRVVSTKLSSRGNVFLNLDKRFPNQIFTISIFKDQMLNFSYPPHQSLEGKLIEVSGEIASFNGVPSMVIQNEKAIKILD